MNRHLAAALVFLSSAAVLVFEIVAARLLTPYVGSTLETYTAIIGVILAGIAAGSWAGGKAADRHNPTNLIGPLLVVGGALAFLSIPIVDALGAGLRGAGPVTTTVITVFAFFAPAAVLSAVTPAVIKLQLSSLTETGQVVGRLSAISTTGAILGTFLTGFVLVGLFPSRSIVRVTAVFLILLGVWALAMLRRRRVVTATGAAIVGASLLLSYGGSHPCVYESTYFCAYVTVDPDRPSGRSLWLDTLRHSYVDVQDPGYLEFAYMQWFGDVLDGFAPSHAPFRSVHIGGAGFTMPRYLDHQFAGSTSTVLELDPMMVSIAIQELGLPADHGFQIAIGDARATLVPDGQANVIIGDAFGGVAVPWHLTTVEFTQMVADTLTSDGVYLLNVIDYGPKAFLRAQLSTLSAVFPYVAALSRTATFATHSSGGNVVLIASHQPLPLDLIQQANRSRGRDDMLLFGEDLLTFHAGAPVLTDDFAPVDQLLTARPSR
jgi:spermidine synthase